MGVGKRGGGGVMEREGGGRDLWLRRDPHEGGVQWKQYTKYS